MKAFEDLRIWQDAQLVEKSNSYKPVDVESRSLVSRSPVVKRI